MKKISIITLSVLLLASCLKDEELDESFFWGPIPVLERSGTTVTLYLVDPRPYVQFIRTPSNPESFEIYSSTDGEDFSLHSTVDASTLKLEMENLTNGGSYYYYVKTTKGNYTPVFSDTIMTMAGENEEPAEMFTAFSIYLRNMRMSYDGKYVAAKSSDVGGWSMLVGETETDIIRTVNQVGFRQSWSPIENKLVYLSELLLDNTAVPDHMIMYDADAATDTILLDIDYSNYYLMSPRFTPEGSKIIYLSSEDNETATTYDFWKLDLQTGDNSRLTDFETDQDITIRGTISVSSEDEIYFDGVETDADNYNIYKYTFSTGVAELVVGSPWQDYDPEVSPDKTKLAFVSTRTGTEEIWLYDLTEGTYRQITGNSDYSFDARYCYIDWLNDTEILISMYGNNQLRPYKLNLGIE